MFKTIEKVVYKAFGLQVISDIRLPELFQCNSVANKVDISITVEDLSALWGKYSKSASHFIIRENMVMFQIPDTAIFCIRGGNEIIVSPLAGSSEDQIRLYVLGTCMGALLIQRKNLPLHGSAISINGKAYAIVGDSGAGKSTLASAFLNSGHHLLSDDVIPVHFSKGGIPIVTPSYPQQKLWQESLNAFGMQSKIYKPIYDRKTKFAIPVKYKFSSESMPLAGVFELVKTNNADISLNPIFNLESLQTLFKHTYRNFLISELGLMEWHFQFTATLANQIHVYKVERPQDRFTANDLRTLILNNI